VSATPIAAVVFDFDGTLADTRAAVVATVTQTLDRLGAAPLSAAAVVERMGLPLSEVFVAAGLPPPAIADAVVLYRRLFPDNAGSIALFPEVDTCLGVLATRGLPLTVASSRGRESLDALLDALQIRSRFHSVLGEEDAARKKPAPDLVLALAERLALAPSQMLVVGDTTYDIEMGRAAGAHTCGVVYGAHDAERLTRAQPTWLVDSLAAVPALLSAR
jgi:phosphoglycolate phosphatase